DLFCLGLYLANEPLTGCRLTKVFHQHDIRLCELVLNIQNGSAIGRYCKSRTIWILQSPDRNYLVCGKFEELYSGVVLGIDPSDEVNSPPPNCPVEPGSPLSQNEGSFPALQLHP